MVVVQRVDTLPPHAINPDQRVLPKHAKLMRHSRLLHAERLHKLADRVWPFQQAAEDLDTVGRGQREHRVGDLLRGPFVDPAGVFPVPRRTHAIRNIGDEITG